MANLSFNRTQGGLGRPLDGYDHVTGMAFWGSYPSGFSSTNKERKIFSLQEAVDLGIVNTSIDETAASGGNFAMSNAGAAGDIVILKINEGEGAFELARATVEAGETTSTLAVKLRASCNDTSVYSHGYSAAGTTLNVLLSPPVGLGDSINGGSALTLVVSSGSAAAATITQFSSGVDGFLDVIYYQVCEFFRIQPKGVLYIGIYPDSTMTASRVQDLQTFAGGEIRQIGVFDQKSVFASSKVTALQTVADTLEGLHMPLSIVLASDMTGLTLSTIANLTTLDSERVSVLISGDGKTTSDTGYGAARKVFYKKAYTVAALGACMGTIALAKVHEDIGWIGKFNISDGDNLNEIEFLPTTSWTSASAALKTQLGNYAYLFLTKETDLTGSYWNNDKTSTLSTSDYARIRNVRSIDKAVRGMRVPILPLCSSPVYVNTDGTLPEDTIAVFENAGNQIIGGQFNTSTASGSMVVAGELSAGRCIVNPTQNVLTTGKISITAKLIPVGAAEEIEVNIGFVASFT